MKNNKLGAAFKVSFKYIALTLVVIVLLLTFVIARLLWSDYNSDRVPEVFVRGDVGQLYQYKIENRGELGLLTTQGFLRGDLTVEAKNVAYDDGDYKVSELAEVSYSDVFAKEQVLMVANGGGHTPVYARLTQKSLPFLDSEAQYEGLELYRGDEAIDLNGFIVDFELSEDGDRLGALVAQLIRTNRPNASICGNCARVQFGIHYVNYNLVTKEFIDSTKLRNAEFLIDRQWSTPITSVKIFNIYDRNIEMVNYENLTGNELIHYSLMMNSDGSHVAFRDLGVYVLSQEREVLQQIYNYPEMNLSLSEASHPSLDYWWSNSTDLWFKVQDQTLGLNAQNGESYTLAQTDIRDFAYFEIPNLSDTPSEFQLLSASTEEDSERKCIVSKVAKDSEIDLAAFTKDQRVACNSRLQVLSIVNLQEFLLTDFENFYIYDIETNSLSPLD